MNSSPLVLHPRTKPRLQELVDHPRGSYILYGPSGIGRRTALHEVVRSWHGHVDSAPDCWRCRQIEAGTYSDFVIVEPDKASLGIAAIQDLQQQLHLTRHDSLGQRLVLIRSADCLTREAQNALLKLLEEPPAETIIALTAQSPKPLLPTLRSRLRSIVFAPLSFETVRDHLIGQYEVPEPRAAQIARLAAGRIGQAITLAKDPQLLQLYQETQTMVEQFCNNSLFDRLQLANQIGESKTISTSLILETLQSYLRGQLRVQTGQADNGLTQALHSLQAFNRFSAQVQANVTLKTALNGLAVELN